MGEKESVEVSVNKFFEHFSRAIELYENIKSIGEFNAIGMGGSGIAGKFFEDKGIAKTISCPYSKELENILEKENTVFVSYSGNTKETLSWLEAENIKNYVALTSGGKLEKKALEDDSYLIKLPEGLQPRASFPYMLMALAKLHSEDTFNKIKEMVKEAEDKKKGIEEKAKAIARELEEPIIIYGDCLSKTIAYRGKTQLNENAKALTLFNVIPEALHNEIEGIKKFEGTILIIGRSNFSRKIERAMKEIFKDKKVLSHFVSQNIIEGVYFVDVLSIEYAKKIGVKDMSKVNTIKEFKVKVNE